MSLLVVQRNHNSITRFLRSKKKIESGLLFIFLSFRLQYSVERTGASGRSQEYLVWPCFHGYIEIKTSNYLFTEPCHVFIQCLSSLCYFSFQLEFLLFQLSYPSFPQMTRTFKLSQSSSLFFELVNTKYTCGWCTTELWQHGGILLSAVVLFVAQAWKMACCLLPTQFSLPCYSCKQSDFLIFMQTI